MGENRRQKHCFTEHQLEVRGTKHCGYKVPNYSMSTFIFLRLKVNKFVQDDIRN
jgi:hypothetical protein